MKVVEKEKNQSTSGTRLMSGAQAVVQALIDEGTDLMFGYPGGAIMPVYDALYDVEEELEHILTKLVFAWLLLDQAQQT